MKGRIVGLCCAVLLLCAASVARADSITITGGQVGTDFVVTGVDFVSDRFNLSLFGGAGSDGHPIFHMPNAFGFHAGDTVDFSATVNGPLRNVGPGVLAGVPYQNQGDILATASLQFNATPVAVTASPGQFGFLVFDVTTPFTMSGSLQVDRNIGTSLNPIHGDVILRSDVVGSGLLDVRGFSQNGLTPTVLATDIPTFTFAAENPSATPEPATLLLLGTGVAGLFARRKNDKSRNRSA